MWCILNETRKINNLIVTSFAATSEHQNQWGMNRHRGRVRKVYVHTILVWHVILVTGVVYCSVRPGTKSYSSDLTFGTRLCCVAVLQVIPASCLEVSGLEYRTGDGFPWISPGLMFHHRVQNGSEAHPASYPVGTRGSFRGREADHPTPSIA